MNNNLNLHLISIDSSYWKVQNLTSSFAQKFLYNILDWDNAYNNDLEEIAYRAESRCNLFDLMPDALEENDR